MGRNLPGSCPGGFRGVALTKEGLQLWGLKRALVLFAFPAAPAAIPTRLQSWVPAQRKRSAKRFASGAG